MPQPNTVRWNIFARELEDILADHKLRLGQLDDLGIVEQREKVRRLKASLLSPAHFPTLNPDELDRLYTTVRLTDHERTRIRAALLATAVERILMDRINADIALMASDDVLNILLAAMRAQPESALVGVRAGAPIDDDDGTGDSVYEEALDRIDRATLSLHVSRQATTPQARRTHAQDAADGFALALTLLRQTRSPLRESDEWRAWEQEALHGQQMAEAILAESERG